MQRVIILVILLFASLSFLVLQLLSIKGLDDQRSWTAKLGNAVSLRQFTNKEDDQSWKNLNFIVKKLNLLNIDAFLVEPDVLQDVVIDQISGHNSSSVWNFAQFLSSCRYLCGKNRIVLGVFDDGWEKVKNSLDVVLIKEGFHSNCCKDQDPRSITLDQTIYSSIDLHCAYTRSGNTIDIAIFYRRQEFLWHGQVIQGNKISSGLVFGKTAGAYDRFKLSQTTMDGISLLIPKRTNTFLSLMKHSRFIECDFKRAKQFYSKFGEERNDEAETFTGVAKDILETAKRALDGLGVRFWLSSGTCLGWFRQCSVIPYSKDVDIGIWIKDYDSRLIDRFQRYGLILKHKFGKVEDSFELSFRTRMNNVKLDIFFFYEEKDYMWNGGTQARTGKKFKYIFPKFTLCWTEFLSMKVRVPCETQSYIEANYGQGWGTPVKKWDWKASPPNVRPNGEWDKKDWSEVIQMM